MNITTLDQRIRDHAYRKLRDEADEALRPLRDMIAYSGCQLTIPAAAVEGRPTTITVSMSWILDLMRTQIPNAMLEGRGNDAVDQFLKEVWSLRDQIKDPEILNEAGDD